MDIYKRSMLITSTVLLLVVLSVAPGAASSPPLAVQFEVVTTIPDGGGPSFGPFTATGPAADAGLICESGETIDVFGKASGFQSQTGVNFQAVKLFTCDDGSGEFLVKLQVRIDKKGDNFNWNILGGSGPYEKLHGTGKGIGLPILEGVLDTYSGSAHVD
jgi:hypothetical protein